MLCNDVGTIIFCIFATDTTTESPTVMEDSEKEADDAKINEETITDEDPLPNITVEATETSTKVCLLFTFNFLIIFYVPTTQKVTVLLHCLLYVLV